MKILHNLNNDMHAHDCPFIPCETFLPFHSYEAYPFFHSLRFTLPFIIMLMLMLYALQFKLCTPILCKSCFLQIR